MHVFGMGGFNPNDMPPHLISLVTAHRDPPLTLCLVPVFLSLRGVLHPAIPAAQLTGGLPGPGNTSTPGGGVEGE